MLKAVIFDMDGVLVDSERFYMARRGGFLKGKGMPVEDPARFMGADGKQVWALMAPGVAPEELDTLMQEYDRYCEDHPIFYDALANPQVKPLFRALREKGLKIGIASSSPRDMVERMICQLELSSLVDGYITGSDCTHRKPDPEIYRAAMAQLGVSPECAVAVEDSTVGIQSARSAGLRVYALRPYGDVPQDQSGAEAILEELNDLLQFL